MTRSSRAAILVSLLFFVKAATLALFVTPLWDVPDEIGHFAYAADLADGRGVLPPGRAVIPPDLVARWRGDARGSVPNWTAVHPPGYHVFAAAALAAARLFTPDFEWQVRLTRLTSAFFGAATLLLLYRLLVLAGAGGAAALAGSAGVGFIPMFSHMASGVSQDTLSAALGAVCAIAWVDLVRRRSLSAGARLVLAIAAAGAVKATIAPAAIVLMALLPAYLPGRAAARLFAAAGLSLVAFSTTALWWLRLGRLPTPPAGPPGSRRHGAAAFFEVFRSSPVADHTLKNFFGLIGWTGGGDGVVRWFQISGVFLAVPLALVLLLVVLTASWVARRDFPAGMPARRSGIAGWALAGAVFLVAFGWLVSRPSVHPVKLFVESLLFALPFVAVPQAWRRRTEIEEVVFSAQLVALGFMLLYFWNVSRSFLLTGQMRGAHGRYYFAVLGFLLLGFYLPAADRLRKWPGRNRALAAAVLLLFVNETAFYASRVIPFYRGVALAAAGRRVK